MNRILYGLIVLILLLPACREEAPKRAASQEGLAPVFSEDGSLTFYRDEQPVTTIRIEIADDEESRRQGLMGREAMPADSGMLFIFDRQEQQSFWMANTPLSLDMFFADREGVIVNVARNTRPLSDQAIHSGEPALYVVETVAGFAARHGIIEGDRIEWERRN
jgi:uncharacterized protein